MSQDDTDMTAEEFLATRERGVPARVVKSREEYDEAISLPGHDPEKALKAMMEPSYVVAVPANSGSVKIKAQKLVTAGNVKPTR